MAGERFYAFFFGMKSTFIKSTFIKKQKKWPKHVEDLCPTIFFVGYLPFSGQFRNKYAGLDFLGCCRDQISFLTAGTSISPKGAVSYTTNTRVHTLYTCCMYVDDGLSISVGEIVFQHSSKTALAAPAPPKTLPDKKNCSNPMWNTALALNTFMVLRKFYLGSSGEFEGSFQGVTLL